MQSHREQIEPPKGVPIDLLSTMETLRWLRSAFGELKSWPDGKLKSSFQEGLLLLCDANVLPLRDQLTSLEKDKADLIEQVGNLKLSCDNLRLQLTEVHRSQPQVENKVVYRTVYKTPWKLFFLFLGLVAFIAFNLGKSL